MNAEFQIYHIGVKEVRINPYALLLFLLSGKLRLMESKSALRDVHLAEKKLIALQYRSGAKESQATLCSEL